MFAAVLRRLFRRSVCGRGPTRRGSARRARARWLADAWAVRRRRSAPLRGGISLAAEGLEPRLALAAPDYSQTVDLVFNVPAATAALGLQIGVYSNKSQAYLDATPVNGTYDFESYGSLGSAKTLPLITVASPGSSGGPVTLKVALDQEVVSGELIMFVGNVTTGLPYNGTSVSTPKSATDPSVPVTPDTFAQFEFNFSALNGPGDNPGLDIDISSVDSTGFPFALVYPQSGKGAVGYPLNPLGITVSHQGLHDNLAGFLANQGSVNGTSVSDLFEQCATYVQQQDSSSLQVVAPGDILSNGTNGPTPGFQPASGKPIAPFTTQANAASTLAPGATYSYIVTAYSDNLIDGTQIHGETVPSVPITVTPLTAGHEIQVTWTPYRDPNTAGYNIYRYAATDGTAPTDATLYNLVGSVSGMLPGTGDYFTFTDTGLAPQATQISVAAASPYGFNPLSEYYTKALKDFFKHYEAPGSFAIHRDGVLWVGNTVEYAPTASWNTGGYTYRMLQLTAQNATTTIPAGAVVNIYEPFFSTNTRFVTADAPPMPNWLQAGTSLFESPAEMVFGCDGVFASNTFDPDSFKSGKVQPVGDIENSIVSAFNRGIATTFYDATTNTGLVPDNWASFPNFTTPQTVDRTTPTNNLYYAVTAVNVYGETTASATVLAKQGSTLTWANGGNAAPATTYNVYAGTSPDALYLQTTTKSPSTTAPAFTSQITPLPYRYFAPNSTSNFYAAYVSSDSLLDPVKGVSINGLSYGYAYSDQGGVSTNLFFSIDAMPPTVAINLGVPSGPGFVTQLLPTATVGSPYSATIVPSGTASATFAVDPLTPLPAWATLAVNGTITGTPTAAGNWAFTVQGTSGGTTNTQSYVLSATSGAVAGPLSAAGLAAGVLTLPQADVGIASTAQVVPNGGAGGPYWLALDPTKTAQLPSGISLPIGSGPIASQNGVFTLSGTQGTAQTTGISVVMSDKTAAVASASYGISTAQFTLSSAGSGYTVKDQFPVTGGGGTGAAIVVKTVSGTGAILTWDVVPGTGFTSATGLAVAASSSKKGKGASFLLADNPGTFFQPVVTILNGGSGYMSAPTVTFYGSGSPQSFTAQLTGSAVSSVAGLTATFAASAAPLLVSIDPPTPGASLPFTMNLTVNPQLAVTTTSLPAAGVGQSYNQLLATNNAGTVTFSLASGSLPAGLTLTPWGLITGTATTAAAGQPFTVKVTDAAGGQTTQTLAGGITVTASVSPLQVTTTSLPATAPLTSDSKPVTYSFNPFTTVSGGVAPYTYTVVNGTLPGPSLDATTGAIKGSVAANAAGTYPLTVRVTDAVGTNTFAGLTLDVLGITAVNGLPLDPTNASLRANATVLTLEGAGFDATPANNQVTLSSGTATVTHATPTSVTLQITSSVNLNQGPLTATIKNSLGTSATVTVANVIAAQPVTITKSTATVAPSGSLVIAGTGFSTTPADNVVRLSSGTATVTAATATSLTLAFTSPPAVGPLTATVTVEGVASAPTQVATVTAGSAKPTVNVSAASILSTQTTLEITGTGFSTTAGETAVALTQGDKQTSIPFASLKVNSPTSLTLTGVSLGSYNGVIFATVTVNGLPSTTTQVGSDLGDAGAIIAAPSPDGFAANGSVLVINGRGFTSNSTVTLTPQYSTGPGQAIAVTPQFDSPNRLVLTGLAIPTSVLSFSSLPSGSNYTSAPQVVFSGGGAAVGDQAVGYATVNASKQVNAVYVTTPGSYTSAPTVTFSGGQPTITGSSAAGTGSGLGTITGLSNADATSAQAWLTASGSKAAPFSGPGIPANAVITFVDTGNGTLDFAFPSTSQLDAQAAAFSLGAAATTTVTLATLQSIQAAVSDPAVAAIPVVKPLSGGPITPPTVTGGTLVSNAQGGTLTIAGTGFQPKGTIDVHLFTGPDALTLTPLDGFVATSDTGSGVQSVTVDSASQLSVTLAGPLPVGNVWAAVASAGVPMLGLGGPVVVATVTGSSLTTTTTSISAKPITLAISGNGFATASGSENIVMLSTGPDSGSLTPVAGAIVSVVATSSTGLEVTLDGAVPLPAGPLWATVSVDGTPLGTVQVATVAATGQAPDITTSTGGLAIAAPSLAISGTGFSTTANGNSVQLFTTAGPLGSAILVTAASPTALIVPLPPRLITAGPLYATVTTASGASAKEQVATVVAGATPTVTTSTLRLAANAPQLVIAGTGFSTTPADNMVALSSGVAQVIAATATSLTLQFKTAPTTGPLVATVTSNGLVGSPTTVATVVAASTPTITAATTRLPTSAATLVITGSGFDTTPGGTNLVALSSGTVSKVTVNSPTQLTVTLGASPAAGKLLATVTVDGVASAQTQVAAVGSTPVVTASSALFAANAGTLTITGTGFDPVATNNTVTLSSGSAIVLVATSEALVLQFTQQPRAGQLRAVVVSDGISGTQAQVATVYATVAPRTGSLQAIAKTLTITGAGFDAVTPGNNVVALSSGTGTVTKATATSLTLTFTQPPTPGPLTATVVVDGISNPGVLPLQVATVVPGPVSAARSTLFTAAGWTVQAPLTVVLQARDANGNPLTTGGARVRFTSSSKGGFSKVTDNGNGTYSATFTTSRVGTQTFSATVNRAKVASTATTGFVFGSGGPFAGSYLSAPWQVRGNFFVQNGFAFGLGSASNIATYSGGATRNVTVSATVSNVPFDQGIFGGVVARYSGPTSHYRAGIVSEFVPGVGAGTFAVIQAVGSTVKTLARQLVGSGLPQDTFLTFTVSGSSLSLAVNGQLVAEATSSQFTSGTVGFSGGNGPAFSTFSAG